MDTTISIYLQSNGENTLLRTFLFYDSFICPRKGEILTILGKGVPNFPLRVIDINYVLEDSDDCPAPTMGTASGGYYTMIVSERHVYHLVNIICEKVEV